MTEQQHPRHDADAPVPATMRAVRYTGAGGGEVVEVAEEPVPRPGPGEVLVRVAAAGLNRADVMQRHGRYPAPAGESEIPGLEVSGTVVELGPGAEAGAAADLAPGTRVCALLAGGGYAEYAVVPVGQLMAVPEGLDLVEAAAFPEVACTVWTNLSDRAGVAAGDWVLVHGGSGGIGSFALQYLTALGARVIATASGEAKLEHCRRLGAEHAIDYTRAVDEDGGPAFAEVVRDLTGGHGADVVLDVVGAPYLAQNVAALAVDGRIVTIAVQGGAKAAEYDMMSLVAKRGWLTGSTLRARSRAEKARVVAGAAKAALPLVAAGRVALTVQARFGLEQARQAQEHFESAERTGKVLLVMSTDTDRGEG